LVCAPCCVFALNEDIGDITDAEFIQAHEALGQTIRVDEAEQKNITLKFSWDIELTHE
jgi:hypothetical protein